MVYRDKTFIAIGIVGMGTRHVMMYGLPNRINTYFCRACHRSLYIGWFEIRSAN
jgi:hypothetical protein